MKNEDNRRKEIMVKGIISWRVLGSLLAAIVLAAGIATFYMNTSTKEAEAHSLSGDSVRNTPHGGILVWENHSRYLTEIGRADQQWGELDCRWGWSGGDPCAGVDIAGETSTTGSETVELWDVNNCNYSWLGRWSDGPDPDEIYFNVCRMDKKSSSQKQWVATHEFGHGLKLAHPPCTSTYSNYSVMVGSVGCAKWASPRPHDDNDYYNIWVSGRYGYS